MASFARQIHPTFIPQPTSPPGVDAVAMRPPRFHAATLVAACRSAVRPLVGALRPRVGSRRAGRGRPTSRPVDRTPVTAPCPERDPGFRPDFDHSAMTIVITRASDVRRGATALVARLAELAVYDELLVVYGSNVHGDGPDANALTVRLRHSLPRYDVVELHVAPHAGEPRRGAALLNEFLEIGSLPIVVTPVAAVRDIVAELSSYLRADRVLSLSCTAGGADLRQVWARRQPVGSHSA